MTVSFVIVARNAEMTLPDLLQDLVSQTYDKKLIQLIFIDSCSSDRTKEIFIKFKMDNESKFLSIVIRDNLKVLIPCGWNVALDEATCDIIVRVNAHSRIPKDFIEKNIYYHERGELITGGPVQSIVDGHSTWKHFLLFLESSLFGRGFAKFRNSKSTEYVDTILNAFYNRKIFDDVGKFNEYLPRSEDNEMHYRMRERGYKLLLIKDVKSFHHIRNSLKKMSLQKFLNGKYVGLTLGVSPKSFSLYHFIPFVFVLSLICSLILLFFSINLPFVFLISSYFIASIATTILSMVNQKFEFIYLLSPLFFFYLHFIYGFGTLCGILLLPFWKRKYKKHENGITPSSSIT